MRSSWVGCSRWCEVYETINSFEKCCKRRELGGYAAGGQSVKHGCLLRTAALTTLSPEDSKKLSEC